MRFVLRSFCRYKRRTSFGARKVVSEVLRSKRETTGILTGVEEKEDKDGNKENRKAGGTCYTTSASNLDQLAQKGGNRTKVGKMEGKFQYTFKADLPFFRNLPALLEGIIKCWWLPEPLCFEPHWSTNITVLGLVQRQGFWQPPAFCYPWSTAAKFRMTCIWY